MIEPIWFGGYAILLAVCALSTLLDRHDRRRAKRRRDTMLHVDSEAYRMARKERNH